MVVEGELMKSRSEKLPWIVLALVLLGILIAKVSSRRSDPPEKRSTKQGQLVHTSRPRLAQNYGRLPLSFELNKGQTDSQVKFLSRGRGYTMFLTQGEAVLALRAGNQKANGKGQKAKVEDRDLWRQPSRIHSVDWATDNGSLATDGLFSPLIQNPKSQIQNSPAPSTQPQAPDVVRLKLVAANANAKVVGLDPLPGKTNYFIGNDPKKWRTNVPTYAKVKYKSVYPGIDLVYYGNQRQLEYDFVVAPGADPRVIALDINGAEKMQIDPQGDLVLSIHGGDVRFHKPVVYQVQSTVGSRQSKATDKGRLTTDDSNPKSKIENPKSVEGRFLLLASNRVGFEVPNYDKTLPLIIDPVLSYSTYLGGSGGDFGWGLALDSSGYVYVAGSTRSANFPTLNAYDPEFGGGMCWDLPCADAFVTKLDPSGSELVYSTYLGGTGEDAAGWGLAVDAAGSAYITGQTLSTDFPTMNPLQGVNAGDADAFVAKLNPAGDALLYSTYLGGIDREWAYSITVDSSGNAYLAGTTYSADFPTVSPLQEEFAGGESDVFVAKLNAAGSELVYATYIGGTQGEYATGIAVHSSATVYVAGQTGSADFPTTPGAFQTAFGGAGLSGMGDAFVLKLNPSGSAFIYSTYLGGSRWDPGDTLAIDSSGNAYVAGWTSSSNFPTTPGSVSPTYIGGAGCLEEENWEHWLPCWDGFLAKLNPTGTALVYSTYLGGTDMDQVDGVVADAAGNAYVSGISSSLDFPIRNAFQPTNAGSSDGFVMKLNSSGALIYSTYIGGAGNEDAFAVALDTSGSLYVTGTTCSADFPTTPGAFQTTYAGGCLNDYIGEPGDAFVVKIDSRTFAAHVQPPIEADGSSVFKAKRGVVPVKFKLTADGARTCDLYPATIAFFRVGSAAPEPVNESEFIMASDDGLNFRVAGCQYEYNLSARSLGPGKYRVEIWMGGVKVGEATFGLK